jgi:predicted PurR-regulated permease PerM
MSDPAAGAPPGTPVARAAGEPRGARLGENAAGATIAWPPVPPRRHFADAPSIYAALLLFGLTVGGVYLLLRLELLLTILFLAALIASAIAGPVRRLEGARLPRGMAILVVYAVILAVIGALGWYVLPRLVGQAADAATDLPGRLRDIEQLRARVSDLAVEYPILADLESRLVGFAGEGGSALTGWLLGLPGAVAKGFFTLLSVFTIAFLLLTTKERLLDLILSLIQPDARETTRTVLAEMAERLGAYVRAKLIVVVIVGAAIWATLFFLGSDYAVLVAIFAGLFEILPRVGPWIGRAAIFLAALPLGWGAVVIAMVAHVVIENIKGQFLSPLIESDQVEIHPLTAFIAIIAGGILLGWLGALIAVPAAAVIQVLVEYVFIPWRRKQVALAAPRPAIEGIGVEAKRS